MKVAKQYFFVLASLMLTLQAPAARAQDQPEYYAADLRRSCPGELRSQCRNVREGGGRLIACLYAHDDRLSTRCGEAVYGSLERLGVALGALANVRRACEGDVRRWCSGMIAGDGNLIGCLSQARQSVSSQCNATLDAAFLRP